MRVCLGRAYLTIMTLTKIVIRELSTFVCPRRKRISFDTCRCKTRGKLPIGQTLLLAYSVCDGTRQPISRKTISTFISKNLLHAGWTSDDQGIVL